MRIGVGNTIHVNIKNSGLYRSDNQKQNSEITQGPLVAKDIEGGIKLQKPVFALTSGQYTFDHGDGTVTIERELSEEAYEQLKDLIDWKDGAWQETVTVPDKYRGQEKVDAMDALEWKWDSGASLKQSILDSFMRTAGGAKNAKSINIILRAPGEAPKSSIEQLTQEIRNKLDGMKAFAPNGVFTDDTAAAYELHIRGK